ncbi:MAG: pyridoxal phosphate-dependent aminotransferase [Clostridia bacterium]|nr:pyridoxal phosphate-dependent aminotransferase [Clostridia bacterium]
MKPSASMKFMKKAADMKAAGVDVMNLSGGEPDFDTPAKITCAGIKALTGGDTHYRVGQGLPALRARIAKKLKEENGISLEDNEILVTPGGKTAIYLSVRALVNKGDEVIILNPAWVSYEPIVIASAGTPVNVELKYEQNYEITMEALESATTAKTKMLIINYPNNPTGRILSEKEAKVIVEWMKKHEDVVVLSDEVYECILFDNNKNISLAKYAEIADRVITVNSFSKSVAMTGWRIGYVAAPRYMIEKIYKIYQHSLTCMSGFIQQAATVALDCKEEIEEMRKSYEMRRDIFIDGLNKIPGVHAEKPQGAFYAWVKIDKKGMDSFQICDYLIEEAKVVGVPGDSYGFGGDKCIRFSFATDLNDLKETVKRIEAALAKLN